MSVIIRWACPLLAGALGLAPPMFAQTLPCWESPVHAAVSDPFREPRCPWCPGNRGIEYATTAGVRVRAVATGRVSFAGTIAGTVYVVVRHGGDRRVTYANLIDESFSVGDLVVRGQTIGRTAGRLHFGLRVGDRYVDPAPLLGRWVHRPRLIPVDGGPGNPAPAPRLRCGSPGRE
jgi:murein DD-endopeptidase MepM/ murein hydrolase activator NlpD